MTVGAALPKEADGSDGIILSFILPFGCDLRCSFCFIEQRNEVYEGEMLAPDDYTELTSKIESNDNIFAFCIQGKEPLPPNAFPYTKRVLKYSFRENMHTSLATNKTNLSKKRFDLSLLKTDQLAITLESAIYAMHNRTLLKDIAFNVMLNGIYTFVHFFILGRYFAVASVLISKKWKQLVGMPRSLNDIAVSRWFINALLVIRANPIASTAGNFDNYRRTQGNRRWEGDS